LRLIGLSGKALAGKDTTAGMLMSIVLDRPVVRIAFADALKDECMELHGWNGLKDDAGRTLLQQVGVARRAENPNYWVERAMVRVADPETLYVFTDVRFQNEADTIRQNGGRIWRIERIHEDGSAYDNGMTGEQKAHVSETALDKYPFDDYLFNDTLPRLRRQVEHLAREL
jgi:hypothetical protein